MITTDDGYAIQYYPRWNFMTIALPQTLQTVVTTAHGINNRYDDTYKCSVCGEECETPKENEANYCPNCGAKMDVEVSKVDLTTEEQTLILNLVRKIFNPKKKVKPRRVR